MLTNFDILNIAKTMKINLITVCSKDELSKLTPKVGGYIINLQNSDAGNGTHWTSFLLYQDNNSYKSMYFDSYGMPAPREVERFIHRISPDKMIPYSTRMLQKMFTSECGWYCLNWLFNMQYKRRYKKMVTDYYYYIASFSNDLTKDLQLLKKTFSPYEVNFYTKTVKLKK